MTQFGYTPLSQQGYGSIADSYTPASHQSHSFMSPLSPSNGAAAGTPACATPWILSPSNGAAAQDLTYTPAPAAQHLTDAPAPAAQHLTDNLESESNSPASDPAHAPKRRRDERGDFNSPLPKRSLTSTFEKC